MIIVKTLISENMITALPQVLNQLFHVHRRVRVCVSPTPTTESSLPSSQDVYTYQNYSASSLKYV